VIAGRTKFAIDRIFSCTAFSTNIFYSTVKAVFASIVRESGITGSYLGAIFTNLPGNSSGVLTQSAAYLFKGKTFFQIFL
jgi:hypothetical protein